MTARRKDADNITVKTIKTKEKKVITKFKVRCTKARFFCVCVSRAAPSLF